MIICVGYHQSTEPDFDYEHASEDEIKAEVSRQAAERPEDKCIGIHNVHDFEDKYNKDCAGYYALDAAFYWIRFIEGEK